MRLLRDGQLNGDMMGCLRSGLAVIINAAAATAATGCSFLLLIAVIGGSDYVACHCRLTLAGWQRLLEDIQPHQCQGHQQLCVWLQPLACTCRVVGVEPDLCQLWQRRWRRWAGVDVVVREAPNAAVAVYIATVGCGLQPSCVPRHQCKLQYRGQVRLMGSLAAAQPDNSEQQSNVHLPSSPAADSSLIVLVNIGADLLHGHELRSGAHATERRCRRWSLLPRRRGRRNCSCRRPCSGRSRSGLAAQRGAVLGAARTAAQIRGCRVQHFPTVPAHAPMYVCALPLPSYHESMASCRLQHPIVIQVRPHNARVTTCCLS